MSGPIYIPTAPWYESDIWDLSSILEVMLFIRISINSHVSSFLVPNCPCVEKEQPIWHCGCCIYLRNGVEEWSLCISFATIQFRFIMDGNDEANKSDSNLIIWHIMHMMAHVHPLCLRTIKMLSPNPFFSSNVRDVESFLPTSGWDGKEILPFRMDLQ